MKNIAKRYVDAKRGLRESERNLRIAKIQLRMEEIKREYFRIGYSFTGSDVQVHWIGERIKRTTLEKKELMDEMAVLIQEREAALAVPKHDVGIWWFVVALAIAAALIWGTS